MKKMILGILAISGLVLTLLPSILVFTGDISKSTHQQLMIIGFVLWFVTAPAVIKRR